MNHARSNGRRAAIALVSVVLCSFLLSTAAMAKDSIVFGGARSITGNNAIYTGYFGLIAELWSEEVNARGGIYVKEYDKKLKIELKVYDDKSDMATMTRLMEKLIIEDKVDFLLPPNSTSFLYAGAVLADKHKKVMIGGEGGLSTLKKKPGDFPYLFGVLQYAEHFQIPVLADIFEELGVKNVGILYIEDLHGVEYNTEAKKEFKERGIDIVFQKSAPPFVVDVSQIVKEAKRKNVDAFCAFVYPPTTFMVPNQMREIDFNPKALVLGPGGSNEVFLTMNTAAGVEGIMAEGAFNEKSSAGTADLVKRIKTRYGKEQPIDWWGHAVYWAAMEVWEQAIERAGTLDQDKIREIMATQTFKTILGPETKFDELGLLTKESYTGQIGQWQNGIFEVIDPGPRRTAEPQYPKAPWAKIEQKK